MKLLILLVVSSLPIFAQDSSIVSESSKVVAVYEGQNTKEVIVKLELTKIQRISGMNSNLSSQAYQYYYLNKAEMTLEALDLKKMAKTQIATPGFPTMQALNFQVDLGVDDRKLSVKYNPKTPSKNFIEISNSEGVLDIYELKSLNYQAQLSESLRLESIVVDSQKRSINKLWSPLKVANVAPAAKSPLSLALSSIEATNIGENFDLRGFDILKVQGSEYILVDTESIVIDNRNGKLVDVDVFYVEGTDMKKFSVQKITQMQGDLLIEAKSSTHLIQIFVTPKGETVRPRVHLTKLATGHFLNGHQRLKATATTVSQKIYLSYSPEGLLRADLKQSTSIKNSMSSRFGRQIGKKSLTKSLRSKAAAKGRKH